MSLMRMLGQFSGTSPTRILPDLNGKKAVFVGDSITVGAYASTPDKRWTSLVAVGLNAVEENRGHSGQGIIDLGTGSGYDFTTVPAKTSDYGLLFINLSVNDIHGVARNGYTYWDFEVRLRVVLDYLHNTKGWAYAEIVLDTTYYIAPIFSQDIYTPWRIEQFRQAIIKVGKEKGVILADLWGYMASLPDPGTGLADAVHQNDIGMQRAADFHLLHLDYVPAVNTIDPNIMLVPFFTTADEDIDLATVGVDATNTEIIFKADDPLQCYVPGKVSNTITGMITGEDYYVVPKLYSSLNLATVGLPAPVTPSYSGAAERAAFVTATGRTSQAAAIEDFISALKSNNLWWRMYGFWILDTSFNVAKYNLRDSTATLTEVGTGTYDSDGWTGGLSAALLAGISPDDYDMEFTAMVSINTDVHENGIDFGMASLTNSTKFRTRMDYAEPPVASFTLPSWNGWQAFGINTTSAVGRWYMTGGDGYVASYFNGGGYVNWYSAPPLSSVPIGEFSIGNADNLIKGSTKKMRLAGIFHNLTNKDVYVLDGLIADLEAAL